MKYSTTSALSLAILVILSCLVWRPLEAQDSPAIVDLEIAIQDTETKELRESVWPGGVLLLEEGGRVRLRMKAIPSGRNRAPRYPSCQFALTSRSGRIRLTDVKSEEGSAVLQALTDSAAKSATVSFQILERMHMSRAMHRGSFTVEVVEDTSDLVPPEPPPGVTLYEYADFQGRSGRYSEDQPTLARNDFASSLRVDPGCQVTLYVDSYYRGQSEVLWQDVEYLGNTRVGNDSVSSLRVSCSEDEADGRVTLYEHSDFRGRSQTYSADQPFLLYNDSARSLRVSPGCRVTLYEHRDYAGRTTVLDRDEADLASTRVGNDSVSSVKIRCGGELFD